MILPVKCIHVSVVMLIVFLATAVNAREGVGIAAIVGDDAISTTDVNERLKLTIFSSGLQGQPGVEKKLLPQVVQMLIDEKLYTQEAENLNITVSQGDIENALRSLESKNNLKPGSFPTFLEEQGLALAALENQLTAQIAWNRVIGRKVRPKVTVTERELEEKLEHISYHTGLAELNISEIVLPIDQPENEPQVRDIAVKILEELRKGAEFSSIAGELSRSTSAGNGGELGWVRQDEIAQDIALNIRQLAVGEVSDPIRVADSYYLIRLNDRKALVSADEDESEVGIKKIFIPWDDGISDSKKKKTLSKLNKEKEGVIGCNSFDGYAEKVTGSQPPKMVMTQLKSLDQNLRTVVVNLDVGKISPVIHNEQGVHVLVVCEKTEAAPSLANKDRIRNVVIREKLQLQARRYVRDLRRNAFIEIRM